MKWNDYLSNRMNSAEREKLPQYALLMYEMNTMIEIARQVAGVELPAMKAFVENESLRIHRKILGNRASDPIDIAIKGMCIAAILEMVENGLSPEEARTFVADVSGQDRGKVTRWHRDFDPTPLFKGDDRYNRTLPDQVTFAQHWIRERRNEMTPAEAVKVLFAQLNKGSD